MMVVDGQTGEVFISPDEDTLKLLRDKQQEDIRKKQLLQELKGKENVTLDGTSIHIYANIGGVADVGAFGILFLLGAAVGLSVAVLKGFGVMR